MLKYVIHMILWINIKVLNLICLPIRLKYWFKSPKLLPPISSDILLLPARKLAESIRKGELSSEEVVKAYIKRVQEVNPTLNAVVEDRFELAICEAKIVDDFLRSTSWSLQEIEAQYPLLGVPVTIKESIAVKGMSFNSGIKFNRKTADEDAKPVAYLKKAGAVPILVSNTPELCLNWETVNKVTGATRNPHDSRRTCGGSSGGEAALLASGASVIGLGSDVAGSLRLPPSFCGVFGHKTSPRLVSVQMNFPASAQEMWPDVFVVGPMSRYACDLDLLLNVIVEPECRDLLKPNKPFNIENVKVYYMEGIGGRGLTNTVDVQILTAMRRTVGHLKNFLHTPPKQVFIKEMVHSVDISMVTMLSIRGAFNVFQLTNRNMWAEMLKTLVCAGNVEVSSMLFVIISNLVKTFTSKKRLEKLQAEVSELKSKLEAMLGNDGVLFYPTFPEVDHFHGTMLSKTLDATYMTIFNSLGLPVTVCPVGLHSSGIPIGIQVVAKQNNDRLTIAVAKEMERLGLSTWIPPKFDSKYDHQNSTSVVMNS